MSWPTVALADISESIEYGVTASASKQEIGPKFLRITDIQNGSVEWETVPYCDADPQKLASSRLKEGDVVFARTGATTGKSFLIKTCPENAVFASYLIRVRPSVEVESSYLAHFFDSADYWNQITLKASGAAQPGVNSSKLKQLKIPLPPLEEQKRIAGILDQADALCRLRHRALDRLNTLGQAIFHEMFGDPISNERKWSAVEIGETEIEISDGNYAEKYPKTSDFIESGVPFVRANNIKNGTLVANDLRYISDEKHELLQKGHLKTGDVLITTRGKIGNLAVVPEQFENANINAQLVLLRCLDETIRPEFLYFQLSQQSFQRQFEKIQTGVALKQLPVKKLKKLEIILPAVSMQNEFTEKMQRILKQREKQKDCELSFASLFASLQHRAFRGEL